VGISVSRVGGDAQTKAMKRVAGKLKTDMAQYYELAAFSQFGSELDRATREQLERGQRITEILKQPQYVPMPLEQQVMIIYAVTNGFLDRVPVGEVRNWESNFHRFMTDTHPEIGQAIATQKELTNDLMGVLDKAIQEFDQNAVKVVKAE
jgi:F-type H+-transporting ATPase subunit alpha